MAAAGRERPGILCGHWEGGFGRHQRSVYLLLVPGASGHFAKRFQSPFWESQILRSRIWRHDRPPGKSETHSRIETSSQQLWILPPPERSEGCWWLRCWVIRLQDNLRAEVLPPGPAWGPGGQLRCRRCHHCWLKASFSPNSAQIGFSLPLSKHKLQPCWWEAECLFGLVEEPQPRALCPVQIPLSEEIC